MDFDVVNTSLMLKLDIKLVLNWQTRYFSQLRKKWCKIYIYE